MTAYEVLERFSGYALLSVRPKTGRTHQIRIHLAHIGFPVLCDRLYGGRAQLDESELMPCDTLAHDKRLAVSKSEQQLLGRQALHAHRLTFVHPFTAARVTITALPSDLAPGFAALGVDPRHYDA